MPLGNPRRDRNLARAGVSNIKRPSRSTLEACGPTLLAGNLSDAGNAG